MFLIFGLLPPWAWQLIIIVLRASGATNLAESLSLKFVVLVAQKLKNAQSYHANADFKQPFPGHTNMPNFVTGQKLEPKP